MSLAGKCVTRLSPSSRTRRKIALPQIEPVSEARPISLLSCCSHGSEKSRQSDTLRTSANRGLAWKTKASQTLSSHGTPQTAPSPMLSNFNLELAPSLVNGSSVPSPSPLSARMALWQQRHACAAGIDTSQPFYYRRPKVPHLTRRGAKIVCLAMRCLEAAADGNILARSLPNHLSESNLGSARQPRI